MNNYVAKQHQPANVMADPELSDIFRTYWINKQLISPMTKSPIVDPFLVVQGVARSELLQQETLDFLYQHYPRARTAMRFKNDVDYVLDSMCDIQDCLKPTDPVGPLQQGFGPNEQQEL